jgi:sugar phosphate isomerase/epimerase
MQLGIRGHDIYDGKADAGEIINALREASFDTVQLVCHKSVAGVEYAPGSLTETKAAGIGEIFRNNFPIALLGAYFNPVHPNTDIVDTGIAVFRDNIRNAKTIGASVVASETGSYQGDPWVYHPMNRTQEALEKVIHIFSGLAEYAAGFGVNIGIEGAAGHVCHDVAALKYVIEHIKTKNVRVVFDYFNFMDENNRDYLEILNNGLSVFDNIHCFHIKDCDENLRQCGIGQGIIDFPGILKAIKQYDSNAALILEGTPASEAAQTAGFLRNIWKSI